MWLHLSDLEVRLSGSLFGHAGRVEVRMGPSGAWGTVCDDSFDHNAAAVVCNMLDLGYVHYRLLNIFISIPLSGRHSNKARQLHIIRGRTDFEKFW